MKIFAVASMALCAAVGLAGGSPAQAQAKLCDKPIQLEGFKTCADVAKADKVSITCTVFMIAILLLQRKPHNLDIFHFCGEI